MDGRGTSSNATNEITGFNRCMYGWAVWNNIFMCHSLVTLDYANRGIMVCRGGKSRPQNVAGIFQYLVNCVVFYGLFCS